VNILYSCDDKYSPFTGVSITSLFENNRALREINVYILALSISEENERKFNQLAEQYNRNLIIVDAGEIDKFFEDSGAILWHGSRTTYYRLFIERVIHGDLEKILYIDSDTIIAGSLEELEQTEFEENKALAMILWPMYKKYNTFIGLKEEDLYCNAGVILFDMINWKRLKCSERIMNSINKGYVNFRQHDQDLLCHTLNENIKILPPKYNVLSIWSDLGIRNLYHYSDANESNFYSKEEVVKAMNNPVILHAMEGHSRVPWVEGNRNPFREEWHMYKEMSLWSGITQVKEKTTLVKKIRNAMFAVLPRTLFSRISKVYAVWDIKRHYRKCGHFN